MWWSLLTTCMCVTLANRQYYVFLLHLTYCGCVWLLLYQKQKRNYWGVLVLLVCSVLPQFLSVLLYCQRSSGHPMPSRYAHI